MSNDNLPSVNFHECECTLLHLVGQHGHSTINNFHLAFTFQISIIMLTRPYGTTQHNYDDLIPQLHNRFLQPCLSSTLMFRQVNIFIVSIFRVR